MCICVHLRLNFLISKKMLAIYYPTYHIVQIAVTDMNLATAIILISSQETLNESINQPCIFVNLENQTIGVSLALQRCLLDFLRAFKKEQMDTKRPLLLF